jgi:hypothetical protein
MNLLLVVRAQDYNVSGGYGLEFGIFRFGGGLRGNEGGGTSGTRHVCSHPPQ